ncbi:hypothetical protein VF09_03440 [Nostoc linckia z9]|nr:hypothetical protein VF05_21800 [Nostoc linckia z3]PHK12465.1 hypothetical protein VF09_03440 [Nostoc linckia z9]
MLTDYNPQDAERLQQARLARFKAFVLTRLVTTVEADRLILQGADPEIAIAQTDALLNQAAIVLGTSKLQIFDTENNLVFAAELKSEQTLYSEEAMTAATAARSVEFELAQSATIPVTVPWNRIAAITGETEDQLRSRLKDSGTPFYWSDDGWAVDGEMARELVIRFRTEQGQKEAAMLLENQGEIQANGHVARPKSKPTSAGSGASKPDFQPLKKGITPTLEKYLDFVSRDAARQMEILSDIAQENVKGRRHLSKIVSSYSPEAEEKPTRGEFQVAAKKLMAKRAKQQSEAQVEAESEEDPKEV